MSEVGADGATIGSFILKRAHVEEFVQHWIANSPPSARWYPFFWKFAGLGAVNALLVTAFARGALPDVATWILLAAGVAAAVAAALARRRMEVTHAATMLRWSEPRTVRIHENGVDVQSSRRGRPRTHRWPGVIEIVERPAVIIFMMRGPIALVPAVVIPRSAFPSPVDADAFLAEARRLWQAARSAPPA